MSGVWKMTTIPDFKLQAFSKKKAAYESSFNLFSKVEKINVFMSLVISWLICIFRLKGIV